MKLKRVYIKRAGGEIGSEACYAAWKGFSAKGYPLDFFEWDELTGRHLPLSRDTLVVGGTVAVQLALKQLGVAVPLPLNIPESLTAFAGRQVWPTTLGEVRRQFMSGSSQPVFVKPLALAKEFAGLVLSKPDDLKRVQHLDDELPLQAAEVVVFVSEWRYFVLRGVVVEAAHYKGDCFIHPDAVTVRRAVAEYAAAPVAYGLDLGVTADGRTLLIEANDGFALGCYGLDAVVYAEMLEARWCEIVGLS
ncbi:MAG: ATP-grasp domain-containing protein [Planctomycetes bacterium]|nr:ATP-grasp domain-containing protein [Planctomycetota bacterium]